MQDKPQFTGRTSEGGENKIFDLDGEATSRGLDR